MKRFITVLLIFSFVTSCSTSKKAITELDKKSVSYSCLAPELVFENGTIKGRFFEQLSGREVDVEKKCVTHRTWYGQNVHNHNIIFGTILYAGATFFTVGIVPLIDLLTVGSKAKTYCDKGERKAVRSVHEKRPAEGKFVGKIMVVQLDRPDWNREKDFYGEVLGTVDVPVENDYAEYAVELKGDYKSSNIQCRVDKQTIIRP